MGYRLYRLGGSGVEAVQARGNGVKASAEWGTGKGGVGYRQYRQGGNGVQAVQARGSGVQAVQARGSGVHAVQARGEWGTGSTGKGGVRYRQ